MKVIFLDVDGVLNSEKELLEAKGKSEIFDRPLELLKKLVDETGAKIVLSSTWRYGGIKKHPKTKYDEEEQKLFKSLIERLAEYNLSIHDVTPVLGNRDVERGDEIRAWLMNSKEDIESFVILDDERDMCEFTDTYLVQTSMETGLLPQHVEIAISILNGDEYSIKGKLMYYLMKIWEEKPFLRFGQLVSCTLGDDIFYMTNAKALKKLMDFDKKGKRL